MLRLPCRETTIIFVLFIGNAALHINPDYFVSLLADIQEYYKTSGVFILYDDEHVKSDDQLLVRVVMAKLLLRLSERLIPSQTLGYSILESVEPDGRALLAGFLGNRGSYNKLKLASSVLDMSRHTWLLSFGPRLPYAACHAPDGNPLHLRFNSRVAVHCYREDVLTKWYALNDNRTELVELARWSPGSGISQHNERYYESRFDLLGKTVRIATPTSETLESSAKMYSFLGDLLRELRASMNFSVKRLRESDAFGRWDGTRGQWSGLIGFLVSRQVDLVLAPITLSKRRVSDIDFSKPLLVTKNRIYFKQPIGARVHWSAYFRAFTMTAWCCMTLMFIFSSLLTAYIRIAVDKSNFIRLSVNYIFDNFIRIWGIYCQQGVPDFPPATPLRLVYVTKMLLTLVVWAIYSASITSYLTVLTPSLPFADVQSFVKDASYRLIVIQNSSDQNMILEHGDVVMSSLRPLLKNPDDLPINPLVAFQQVCSERVGFYSSEAVLKGVSGQIPCTLTYIETGQLECLALGLVKRSPYISSINYNLRKLEDSGVLRKLRNWYFHEVENALSANHSPIGFWSIVPLLSIFALGFGFSLLLLGLEYLHQIRHQQPVRLVNRRYWRNFSIADISRNRSSRSN